MVTEASTCFNACLAPRRSSSVSVRLEAWARVAAGLVSLRVEGSTAFGTTCRSVRLTSRGGTFTRRSTSLAGATAGRRG